MTSDYASPSNLVPRLPIKNRFFWLEVWVVYKLGVLGNFVLGMFLGYGVLRHFGLKNKTRKIVKSHKDFEL